jgi:outer membrane protein
MTRDSLRFHGWRPRARRWLAALAVLTAMPAMPAPAAAQMEGIPVSTEAVRNGEPPAVTVTDGAILLTLEEAVQLALERNLDIVLQRYDRAQARNSVLQSLGMYDLLSDAALTALDQQSATTDPLRASAIESQSFGLGLSQLLPTGTDIGLALNGRQFQQETRFGAVPETVDTTLDITLNQPLLRNFGRLATERSLLIARANSDISRQEFERILTINLQQVINAYWALVEARQQIVVAQESLALANELHERNRIQVDVGTLAPLELVQSEATIATRQEEIIRTEARVGDAADELRRLLNFPPGELWEVEIRPVTEPEVDSVPIDVQEAIGIALAERPELHSQRLVIERAEIDARYFAQQTRPRLDFNINYGYGGSADDYGRSFEQITNLDFPGWTTRLLFAYPIQNRSARAQKTIANLGLEQTEVQLEQLETLISTEVRQAARAVTTAAQQIEAARVSVRFQERNLDAERKRYENGMSTSFQITQIQEDLTFARSRLVTATINYETALAAYYRTIGRLLERHGVTIQDQVEEIERFTLW